MNRKSVDRHNTKFRIGSLLVLAAAVMLQLNAQSETPLAYWSFDESIGDTTFLDVSDHGYNATCSKVLRLNTGVRGNALESVVSGYTFHIANSLTAFSTPSFTVEALVKVNVPAGEFQIIFSTQSYPGSADGGYSLEVNDQGIIRFTMVDIGGSDWMLCEGTTVLAANAWYHFAATFDGVTMKSYVNGVLEGSIVRNAGYKVSGKIASIGCQEDAEGIPRNWFNGMIDELMVFDQALSGEVIAARVASYGLTPPVQTPQLVAHWSFEESIGDTTFLDITGQGYNATCSKALALGDGIQGKALVSTVSGYTFHIANSQTAFSTPSFTVEALVKHNGIGGAFPTVFCTQSYPGSADGGYALSLNDQGRIRFSMVGTGGSGWMYSEGTTVLAANTWYHLAITFDGVTLKSYVNGVLEGSVVRNAGYKASGKTASIGCQEDASGVTRNWFNGMIDELMVFDQALTGEMIAAKVAAYGLTPPAPPVPKLVAHWSFDNLNDGEIPDLTGNGYDAVSTPALGVADGVSGKALSCPGTTFDCAVANSGPSFTMNQFTVETWCYSNSDTRSDYEIICNYNKVTSGIRNGFDMHLFPDGKVDFAISSLDGSSWVEAISSTTVLAGRWYHLTGTYDGAYLKLYVNGKLEKSVPWTQVGMREPSTSFRIGCTQRYEGYQTFFLNGRIDEMKMYNYALAADTVAAHYASYDIPQVPTPTPKLLAHWSFDSTDNVTSYFDVSGNGHTATTNQFSLAEGVRGAALDCRSDNFEVRVPSSTPDFVVDQFTMESWIYSYIDLSNPGSFYNYKGIFNFARVGMEGSGYAGGYSIQISDKGKLFTSMSAPQSGSWIVAEGQEALKPRTWYHIAATYDKTTLKLFLNGTQVSQIAAPDGFFMPANTPAAAIGSQFQVTDQSTDAGRIRTRFNGKIDEFKLYNFAIDAASIKSSYESAKPVEEPPFEINLGMKTTFALPGDTVVMPVYITNHEDFTISSLQLTLQYDPRRLTLLSVTKDSGLIKNIELFDWNGSTPGSALVAMAGTAVRLGYGEGELFRCLFVVAPSVGGGDTCMVNLDKVVIDETNNLVVSTTQSGRIIISAQEIIYGDVTGNRQVTVVDAQQVLKYVVGALPLPDEVCCPNFTTAVADVSGNGTVTSYDAALIFQYSLGMVPDFPVAAKNAHPLAKRSAAAPDQKAQLHFTVNNTYQQDALVYDLVGSNLCGFYAGEFAIVCEASAELLSKSMVTTDVRGATLSSKFSATDNLLRVAVSSNDDIDSDGPVAIVRIVLPPLQQSSPVFTVKTALINEGAIATDFNNSALTGLLASHQVAVSLLPTLRVIGNQLAINRENRTPATVIVWDLHGRVVARHTVNGARAAIDIGKIGRGAYIVRLLDGRSSTTARIMLMDR